MDSKFNFANVSNIRSFSIKILKLGIVTKTKNEAQLTLGKQYKHKDSFVSILEEKKFDSIQN